MHLDTLPALPALPSAGAAMSWNARVCTPAPMACAMDTALNPCSTGSIVSECCAAEMRCLLSQFRIT